MVTYEEKVIGALIAVAMIVSGSMMIIYPLLLEFAAWITAKEPYLVAGALIGSGLALMLMVLKKPKEE